MQIFAFATICYYVDKTICSSQCVVGHYCKSCTINSSGYLNVTFFLFTISYIYYKIQKKTGEKQLSSCYSPR